MNDTLLKRIEDLEARVAVLESRLPTEEPYRVPYPKPEPLVMWYRPVDQATIEWPETGRAPIEPSLKVIS